jgi:hypothetical protein
MDGAVDFVRSVCRRLVKVAMGVPGCLFGLAWVGWCCGGTKRSVTGQADQAVDERPGDGRQVAFSARGDVTGGLDGDLVENALKIFR